MCVLTGAVNLSLRVLLVYPHHLDSGIEKRERRRRHCKIKEKLAEFHAIRRNTGARFRGLFITLSLMNCCLCNWLAFGQKKSLENQTWCHIWKPEPSPQQYTAWFLHDITMHKIFYVFNRPSHTNNVKITEKNPLLAIVEFFSNFNWILSGRPHYFVK